VSSLKRHVSGGRVPNYTEFGLRNASFRWNAVDEDEKKEVDKDTLSTNGKGNAVSETNLEQDLEAGPSSADGSLPPESPDYRFELRDISVIFPEGELSVVTGPTASGKTALLVSRRFSYPAKSHCLSLACF
jgi:hypothetical protein